jgi:RNA polymerase sigma-70 factor (ECF subfamily)
MSNDSSDEALIQAVRDGDVDQLSVLFRRYHRRLFDFFSRMNGSAAVSEDLVQEVFLRMLKYRRSFRDGNSFQKWMFQIARNARLQHFNTHRFAPAEAAELHRQSAPDLPPDRQFARAEENDLLERALLRLPEDKRELLVLARYQETPYDVIADWLEIDVGAVKVRVHRAMKELREILRELSGEAPCDVKKSSIDLQTT